MVVIGAGLAGLSAALELSQAGHDVTVLEARERPGGRVHTLREPFSEGLYAEAGAAQIPTSHDWTLQYVEQFGLATEPAVSDEIGALYHVQGKRLRVEAQPADDWPLELTEEERLLGILGMQMKYLGPAVVGLGDAARATWLAEDRHPEYDELTLADLLRSQGASDDAVRLLSLGFWNEWGEGAESFSALWALGEAALSHGEGVQLLKLQGGSDRLPQAFAARLDGRIRYGAAAVRLEPGVREVRVVFLQADARQEITCHHVICAIPCSVLEHLEVVPAFSPAKQRAIADLLQTSVTRVYLQSKERVWADEVGQGYAVTDLPIMETWDMTPSAASRGGILQVYTAGANARRLSSMPEPERLGFAIDHVEKLYPGIRHHIELGTTYSWDDDPWARGAYAWFQPGQMRTLLPHLAAAEGRVHFAGDHTSAWPGWQQGALASGHRAAHEVNEAQAPD